MPRALTVATWAVGVAGVAILVAMASEYGVRRHATTRFPLAGTSVDIGGRRLQMDCQGSGSPTVVFEAGLDTLGMLSWSRVQGPVAKSTRACTYSRAGILGSDPDDGEFNPDTVARDLHAALTKKGIHPPLVLVGHSLGGPYSMIFTRLYPDYVSGLVFVDPSHPDQLARFAKIFGETSPPTVPLKNRLAGALAWVGAPRWIVAFRATNSAPEAIRAFADAYVGTSTGPLLREQENLAWTLSQAGRLQQLGNRPLVVLTAIQTMTPKDLQELGWTSEQSAQFTAVRTELHEDEAAWSSRGRHLVVTDSSHYIQLDKPEVVIDAVNEVVAEVRGQHPAREITQSTYRVKPPTVGQKPEGRSS